MHPVADTLPSRASPLPQGNEPGSGLVHEDRNQNDDWDRYTEEKKQN